MAYRTNQNRAKKAKRRSPLRNLLFTALVAVTLLYATEAASQMLVTVAPKAVQTMTVTAQPAVEAAADTAFLMLVNPWNKLPADYAVELTQLNNGQSVDSRCYPDLQRMMDDCRAAGLSPVICSSYRTRSKQERLYQNKVEAYLLAGYGQKQAEQESARIVAVPGTSEHQLGLAVDIVDLNNQRLDESQEDTPVQQWLMRHSWRYGFVLRYPETKSSLTGIVYEPWHYRYVGKEAAASMQEAGQCLEEYLVQKDLPRGG